MVDPTVTEGCTADVRDPQEKFDVGMGANGDAPPYPMLQSCVDRDPCIRAGRKWGPTR